MNGLVCPECGKEVPSNALACPNCGYPIAGDVTQKQNDLQKIASDRKAEKKKLVLSRKQKSIIAIALAVIVVAFVVVKLTSNPLNGKYYYYYVSEHERYALDFGKSTVTVKHLYYNDSSLTESGLLLDSSKSTEDTYEYELISHSEFSCKGKTYSFTQSSSGHNDTIEFDSKFMGIARSWN